MSMIVEACWIHELTQSTDSCSDQGFTHLGGQELT